jgi:hypothetical protein
MQLCLRLSSKRILHGFQPCVSAKCVVQRNTRITIPDINAVVSDEHFAFQQYN